MWLTQPLDDILSSGTKVAILRMLCLRPGPWSGREIARQLGLSTSNCSRALRELAAAMVVDAQPVGNAIVYRLNESETPLVRRLRDLFGEEAERRRRFANDLARRIPELVSLVLFGSEARGTARATSDVDLLIVVPQASHEVGEEIDAICLQEGLAQLLQASWLIADFEDVRRWEEEGSPFWREVLREGVVLAGHSLERLREYGNVADTLGGGARVLGHG